MSNANNLPAEIVNAVMERNAEYAQEIAALLNGAAAVTKIYTRESVKADSWAISYVNGLILSDGSFVEGGEIQTVKAARRDGRSGVESTPEFIAIKRAAAYPLSVVKH